MTNQYNSGEITTEKRNLVKNNKNTVGIIMASYNSEDFIREQIDSILNSIYQNIHIYVRDDGSTDNTVAIVKEYVEKYPSQIELIENKQNMGLVKNFLTGVMEAKEDYVMFSDHDDVWLPYKVKKTLAAMKKAEKSNKELPIAVFTDATVVDDKLNSLETGFYERSHFNLKHLELSYMLMENKLIGCTIMINRALKDKIRVLPEHARVHDWWVALIASAFGKIMFVEDQTMLYRQHSSNAIGNRNYVTYVTDAVTSLKKQKEKLLLTEKQAEEFFKIYRKELTKEQKKLVYQFAKLSQYSFLKRKTLILRRRYLKSGFVRNFGVLLLV